MISFFLITMFHKHRVWLRLIIMLIWVMVLIILVLPVKSWRSFGLRINTTGSMPFGVYFVKSMPQGREMHGRIVSICVSGAAERIARDRHFLAEGECPNHLESLLKYVVGVSGDRVALSDKGIAINGTLLPFSLRQKTDHSGRALECISRKSYVLRGNEVWIYAPRSYSWDSRYFGPQRESDILGAAMPILTWGP